MLLDRTAVLAKFFLATALFWAPAALAGTSCPASPPTPVMSLPHLKAALLKGQEGLIVALGSSSTEGVMASDPGHSYPAELQSDLASALPSRQIAVINRGIGGQDAGQESARLQDDVLAIRPQLVIWQVGANAALKAEDENRFRQLVTEGVQKMQAAGIDVILMDNQRSPKILASERGLAFDEALADIARQTGVDLFSRDRLMSSWEEEGAPPVLFVATDGLHHNNRGYRCVAQALATEILSAVTPRTLSASR